MLFNNFNNKKTPLCLSVGFFGSYVCANLGLSIGNYTA